MMDLADLFAGWSAALAAWGVGGIALGVHRLRTGWAELAPRSRFIVLGIIAAGVMGAVHQGDQAWLWMHDAYSTGSVRWSTWAYRGAGTVMALSLGGGVAYPRCGHRGWIGLLLIGLLAGAIAVAVSP